jgi:hypothetical protein
MWNAAATWLAHEADDWSIRSGIFSNPNHQKVVKEMKERVPFSSPMRRRPQHMFCAFSYLDLYPNHNIRLQFDADWNEKGVDCRIWTWVDESKFYEARGVYVAVL